MIVFLPVLSGPTIMKPESPAITQEVWNHLLDISRTYRYVIALEKRYRQRRTALRIATYLGTAGVIGSIIGQIGGLPISLSALEMVIAITLNQWWGTDERVAKLHLVRIGMHRIEQEYRDLWLEVHRSSSDIDPEEVLSRSRVLVQETRQFDLLIDIFDDKLSDKCAQEADKVESERYA